MKKKKMKKKKKIHFFFLLLGAENEVVDGDMDELHDETNDTHDSEPKESGLGNLVEL
jgi:hypothetical protein